MILAGDLLATGEERMAATSSTFVVLANIAGAVPILSRIARNEEELS
jgi:hypothetical protein